MNMVDDREVDDRQDQASKAAGPDSNAPEAETLSASPEGKREARASGESEGEAAADEAVEQEAAGGEETGRREDEAAAQRPTYVESLEQRLVQAQDQLREYIQAYKKVKEETEEFKARLEREAEKDLALLRGKVVSELFEVVDNLDRSIAGAEADWDAEAFLTGIKMVRTQFLDKLTALGLEIISPLHEKFDPNEAEAVALVPTTDPAMDEKVMEVFARGYRMDGRVIRPAKVSVASLTQEA